MLLLQNILIDLLIYSSIKIKNFSKGGYDLLSDPPLYLFWHVIIFLIYSPPIHWQRLCIPQQEYSSQGQFTVHWLPGHWNPTSQSLLVSLHWEKSKKLYAICFIFCLASGENNKSLGIHKMFRNTLLVECNLVQWKETNEKYCTHLSTALSTEHFYLFLACSVLKYIKCV